MDHPLTKDNKHEHIIMLGDSDISRWPSQLFPKTTKGKVHVIARGGACICDVKHMFENWVAEVASLSNVIITSNRIDLNGVIRKGKSMIVACAGENDIGAGRSIGSILSDFEDLISSVCQTIDVSTIFFFGPKYEPWLLSDHDSRERYLKLSKAMSRSVERNIHQNRIIFIDCLTMFCEGKDLPGAIEGNRAIPISALFADDGLHLSDDGYAIWKNEIEQRLVRKT